MKYRNRVDFGFDAKTASLPSFLLHQSQRTTPLSLSLSLSLSLLDLKKKKKKREKRREKRKEIRREEIARLSGR